MSPALAARRLGTDALLVQRPQSPVAHVATPRARARRAPRPVCGQHGKRWHTAASTRRRVCGRCLRWLLRNTAPLALTATDLAAECAAAQTTRELDEAIHEIVMRGMSTHTAVLESVYEGQRVAPLHTHVHVARIRILGADEWNRRRRLPR